MPSSKDYKRDYKQEYKTAVERGEMVGPDSGSAQRKRARRFAEGMGMVKPNDGKDIDHRTPISKGGGNNPGNLQATPKGKNRSFKRKSDGSMA